MSMRHLDREAERWAAECLERIRDFSDGNAVETWVSGQAELFWKYKGEKEQLPEETREDYLRAESYLAFFLADAALGCREPACVLSSYSPNHFRIMQSLTLADYLETKSYLNWIKRSDKGLSSLQDKTRDFTTVTSLVREAISKCNWCQLAPKASFWRPACSRNTVLGHSIVVRMASLGPVDASAKYIMAIHHGFHELAEGRLVPWDSLKTILLFALEHPSLVSMFEVLLMRAMLSDFFGRLYSKLIDTETPLHELIEPQAWFFWFLQGCPPQDVQGRQNDYFGAKRYLGCVLTDHMVRVHTSPVYELLASSRLELLQGLSLHEYLVYSAVAKHLSDKRKYFAEVVPSDRDVRRALEALVSASHSWKIKNSSDVLSQIATKVAPHLNVPTIRQAKLNAAARITGSAARHWAAIDSVMSRFYFGYSLPETVDTITVATNMFEVIAAGSLDRLPSFHGAV